MNKLTPIQEKFGAHVGVGTKFVIVDDEGLYFNRGDLFVLRDDDGTDFPFFGASSSDRVAFLHYSRIELYQPFKMGDEVEVRDGDDQLWQKGTFLCDKRDLSTYDGELPYLTLDDDGLSNVWQQCRHPKQDTSITFADGHKVELSEESYNTLRGEA